MEEVNGKWRRQHKEKLYYLNCSPNINRGTSRIMKWTEPVAYMGRGKVHTGGKRQLGRLGCKWEDNIKMYPQIMGWLYGLD